MGADHDECARGTTEVITHRRGSRLIGWSSCSDDRGADRMIGTEAAGDLVVEASPDDIALRFEGADSMRIASNGDLVLRCGDGEVRQRAPVM